MNVRRTLLGLLTTAVAAGTVLVAAPVAQAAAPLGTTSLATVLAADGSGFDRNWRDFDILDNAVHAVLAAKPSSPVAVLADGSVALTAFLPDDRAFQILAFFPISVIVVWTNTDAVADAWTIQYVLFKERGGDAGAHAGAPEPPSGPNRLWDWAVAGLDAGDTGNGIDFAYTAFDTDDVTAIGGIVEILTKRVRPTLTSYRSKRYRES